MRMNLYYAEGEQQVGPIGKSQLEALVRAKKLNAKSLVWQPGMESWQELGVFIRRHKSQDDQDLSASAPAVQTLCSECGLRFNQDEMINFQDLWVCAGCKPLFVQKIKEGVTVAGALQYAGFWIRFAAVAIDAFIMWIANFLLFIPLGMILPSSEGNPVVLLSMMPVLIIVQYAIPAVYDTWFVGKYGATPGKMACNLKVVVEDGRYGILNND